MALGALWCVVRPCPFPFITDRIFAHEFEFMCFGRLWQARRGGGGDVSSGGGGHGVGSGSVGGSGFDLWLVSAAVWPRVALAPETALSRSRLCPRTALSRSRHRHASAEGCAGEPGCPAGAAHGRRVQVAVCLVSTSRFRFASLAFCLVWVPVAVTFRLRLRSRCFRDPFVLSWSRFVLVVSGFGCLCSGRVG